MRLDLDAMVQRLQDVEARHPDTATELGPIIRSLAGDTAATIGTEQARKILGIRSVNTVKRWIELGILAGTWDERSHRWQIPLADALRLACMHDDLTAVGGQDMSEEDLETLASTRPGTLPWQHGSRP